MVRVIAGSGAFGIDRSTHNLFEIPSLVVRLLGGGIVPKHTRSQNEVLRRCKMVGQVIRGQKGADEKLHPQETSESTCRSEAHV